MSFLTPLRVLALSLLAACSSQPEGQPDPFDSERLIIQMGGMRMIDDRPVVNIALKNRTPDPVWVAAHFDAPEQGDDCSLFERIAPGASHTFVCSQSDLIFDRVYAIAFEVFADEARTVLLEQQSTELLFGSEFRSLLEIVRKAQEAEAAEAPKADPSATVR